jgi:hypothetical protein
VNEARAGYDIEDDRLRLIFTCCHPAIDPKVQVPLTLREVCGLTTEEIARAFLTTPPTMAQRIVRGKAKIRDAKIDFQASAWAECGTETERGGGGLDPSFAAHMLPFSTPFEIKHSTDNWPELGFKKGQDKLKAHQVLSLKLLETVR